MVWRELQFLCFACSKNIQTWFVRVKQCDVTCLGVWVPEKLFGFGWKWLRTAAKISRDGPLQVNWSKGEKSRTKSNKPPACSMPFPQLIWWHKCLLVALRVCRALFMCQVMLTVLYFLMGSECMRKWRFCLLAKMIGNRHWLNHWAGFYCWGCFGVFWMSIFWDIFGVVMCEEWKLCLAFLMTFSIFSQTAVSKCPFPKELLVCRLVIVIVTQPGIDRISLYKKSKMMIFNKRFILHGKNLNYCLIRRQATYFAL